MSDSGSKSSKPRRQKSAGPVDHGAASDGGHGPGDAEAAAYIADMLRPIAALAHARKLSLLGLLIDMAALEAADITARALKRRDEKTDDLDGA